MLFPNHVENDNQRMSVFCLISENPVMALSVVSAISNLYVASVLADSRAHKDLEVILQLLCRATGCLFRHFVTQHSAPETMKMFMMIMDITQAENGFQNLEVLY